MINKFSGEHAFLSNFHKAEFTWYDMKWETSENAYQAAKTTDMAQRAAIQAMTPGQAKRAGQKLVLSEDWHQIKVLIMLEIVACKFEQNTSCNSSKPQATKNSSKAIRGMIHIGEYAMEKGKIC